MYKILGADQKEYGPVSAEQVREWIAQGRANAQTRVQPAGATDWRPLADFPEFADALNLAAQARSLPPLPGAPALPVTPPASAKTSGLAITSLVLGILGLVSCGLTSVVGLVLGIIALVKIERSKGQLGGRGVALAGLIVSGLFVLMLPIGAAITLPALARAKARAHSITCMNNVRQLNLGMVMYADANNGNLPAGNRWCEALKPYVGGNPQVFLCKQGKAGQRSHYAFNARLAGVDIKSVSSPATTVMVFEAGGGWDLAGGRELLPMPPRHNGAYVVGFVDGHAEVVRSSQLSRLRWDP